MMKRVSNNHVIVNEGVYKEIPFTICFLRGGYYTCYLDVTKTNLYSVDYNNIDLPVHCGLTYDGHGYPWEKERDFDKYIIGWDYGHCDDAYENEMGRLVFGADYIQHASIGNEHHTIEEITTDCYKAIDAIYEMG